MESAVQTSPEDIVRLVAGLRASRPAYEDFLAFFEKLFLFQESAVAQVDPAPPPADDASFKIRREAGLPLIDRWTFPTDPASNLKSIHAICDYAEKTNETLGRAAVKIRSHLAESPGDLDIWVTKAREKRWKSLEEPATVLGIDPALLFFFLYHSMLPAVLKTSRAMGRELDTDRRPHGTCPVCGDPPALSFLDAEGRRWLVCSFCRHPWATPRMFCPTCARETVREFDYFSSEEEPEYRVYTCDGCRSALTTVDTRILGRPFYPPAEQVVTQHLDMAAREQGFIPAADRTGYPAHMP